MSAIKNIIKNIPGIRPLYRFSRRIYALIFFTGSKYGCPICDRSFRKFFPYREGLEVKENVFCPYCGSAERHRLEFLFFSQYTNIFSRKNKVLHFAPEPIFTEYFCKNHSIEYISGYIEKGRAMCVMDITDIQFEDGRFDYIICNHVLEHVLDEKKALSEIKRVLKPRGKAIITVPISYTSETTLERPTSSDQERLELYGQHDHVRLYGADFPDRLRNFGFEVETFSAGIEISSEMVEQYRLNKGETVYIAIKAIA